MSATLRKKIRSAGIWGTILGVLTMVPAIFQAYEHLEFVGAFDLSLWTLSLLFVVAYPLVQIFLGVLLVAASASLLSRRVLPGFKRLRVYFGIQTAVALAGVAWVGIFAMLAMGAEIW